MNWMERVNIERKEFVEAVCICSANGSLVATLWISDVS